MSAVGSWADHGRLHAALADRANRAGMPDHTAVSFRSSDFEEGSFIVRCLAVDEWSPELRLLFIR